MVLISVPTSIPLVITKEQSDGQQDVCCHLLQYSGALNIANPLSGIEN